MSTRPMVTLALVLAAGGCVEAETEGWYRASAYAGYNLTYEIDFIDASETRCVSLRIEVPSDGHPAPPISVPGVMLHGVEGVATQIGAHVSAEGGCTLPSTDGGWGATPPKVNGNVEFSDFSNSWAMGEPCRVSFDLDVQLEGGERLLFGHDELPLRSVGCPRPQQYVATYVDEDIDAAFGESNGGQSNGAATVVLATWDTDREVCAWARLLHEAGSETAPEANAVDAPSGWVYTGIKLAQIEREACAALNFIVSPTNLGVPSESSPALGSAGIVVFDESATVEIGGASVEAPCSLSIDLALETRAERPWVPELVNLRADAIPVAGACD